MGRYGMEFLIALMIMGACLLAEGIWGDEIRATPEKTQKVVICIFILLWFSPWILIGLGRFLIYLGGGS